MRPDPRAYLWDALHAVELLSQFSAGKSFTDYEADAMLRSAVERQFEIIGEALNQLRKVDAELADAHRQGARLAARATSAVVERAATYGERWSNHAPVTVTYA
ncbi:hypothetical protein SUDANB95_07758 [Actinosynnema sp. ALI-1.44]